MEHNTPGILFVIGAVAPLNSTNANLMLKIIAPLADKMPVHILSVADYREDQTDLEPPICCKAAVLYKYSTRTGLLYTPAGIRRPASARRLVHKLTARLIDRKGFQDAFDGRILTDLLEELDGIHHFCAVCASMEPYRCAYALSRATLGGKKLLYVIDPPADVVPGLTSGRTPFRTRSWRRILAAADLLLTTPRITAALEAAGYACAGQHIVSREFPLFSTLRYTQGDSAVSFDGDQIHLLYCGWLRSEAYLLSILPYLDERFCITFLGNNNQQLPPVETRAAIRTYPAVSHSAAINAILDADILVCIGNPYPVHIPSKIFDYVSSGKPILNLHSLPDCPTLAFTAGYPLALNIQDKTPPEDAAGEIIRFCTGNRGKTVPAPQIPGCTPEEIARTILDEINGGFPS